MLNCISGETNQLTTDVLGAKCVFVIFVNPNIYTLSFMLFFKYQSLT